MAERIVVLRTEDSISFVADACAALADVVNGIRTASSADAEVVRVYVAMVRAYAGLTRTQLCERGADVRVAILDHLLGRLAEAEAGSGRAPLLDVADRLHGELANERALVRSRP